MRRPNILFLMSDEHHADVSGFGGDAVARTPVLDELARTGVVFTNAYTPSPICVPGRMAMMAGQFPWNCDCRKFGDDLTPGYMTFARRFAEYAYSTVACGKLHHMGTDQMQGWTKRVAPDASVSPRYIENAVKEEFNRYSPERGVGKWSNQKEIERAGPGLGRWQRKDAIVMDGAIDFIEDYFCDSTYDRPSDHLPLLLKVSLIQPHYPFTADEDKFNYYLNRVPVRIEERFDHPVLARTQCGPDVDASPRDVRRAMAAYYGMIETIDCHYGEILRMLEEIGQDLDDWIIIYTSDHGDMLGSHGVWEKTSFFEGSVRVPLIVRWPSRFAGGRRVERNVSLCDLFATLCDLCEIPTPNGLDSRSLLPLLEGREDGWPDEVVSQINDHLMIKRGSLKYQHYARSGPEVLFDLATDPGETRNAAGDPAMAGEMKAFRIRARELGASV